MQRRRMAVLDTVEAVGRETMSTEEYDQDSNTDAWLDEIPERCDARPPLGWHPIPHRQLAQVPDDAMKMVRFFILARHYCTDREDVETAGTV